MRFSNNRSFSEYNLMFASGSGRLKQPPPLNGPQGLRAHTEQASSDPNGIPAHQGRVASTELTPGFIGLHCQYRTYVLLCQDYYRLNIRKLYQECNSYT